MKDFLYGILFTLLFQFCYKNVSIFRYYVRFGLLCLLLVISPVCSVISLVYLIPTKQANKLNEINAKVISILAPLVLGINIEIVSGKEYLNAHRPCVFIANHQSNLDMFTMGSVFPRETSFLAKKELAKLPLVGFYFKLAQNFIIDRQNRSKALGTMDEIAKAMSDTKRSIWMYPEGTRSHQTDKSLLPFKKGAFHLAAKGKIPIVPIVFATYAPIYSEKKKIFKTGTVQIKVLEPIYGQDVDELCQKSYNVMKDALQDLESYEVN